MSMSNQEQQDRLLLEKLPAGTDRTLSKLAPSKLPKAYAEAGLLDRASVQSALAHLVQRGLASETKKGRSVHYTATEAGAGHLATLPIPPKPAKKTPVAKLPPPVVDEDPALLPYQQAFLLLQLLQADGRTLTEGMANKFPQPATDELELDRLLANQLRQKLAHHGYLRIEKVGRSVHLTLTDAGLAHLATLRHHTGATFAVRGAALNHLLDAASGRRTTQSPAGAPAEAAPQSQVPPPADVGEAVYAVLLDLTRERHGRDGLVPIFEIRREIARKYGPDAARHEALDQPMLDLWKKGRVRLISISDLRMASAEELAESMSDSYETLFYMEATDGRGHQ